MEDGVDTLGRWMAHHLAELIERANSAKTPAERAAAKDKAVETIIRVWQHRTSSDRINPISDLVPILGVLHILTEKSPPWAYLPAGRLGRSARRTYDLLRRLTISLSFLELHNIEAARRALARARRTAKYQSKEEQEFLAHLVLWLGALPLPKESSQKTGRRAAKGTNQRATSLEFSRIAISIIDEIGAALAQLKEELQTRDP